MSKSQCGIAAAVIIAYIIYISCQYNDLINLRASEYSTTLSLSIAKPLQAMNGEIELLREKVENLQKRFWLEPLEPIWHYRGKFYLGKTTDVEDKDQVVPYFLANFVNASDTALYKRRIYVDLGIKDFDSSLCFIMQNYPIKFDAIYGFECATDFSNVQSLTGSIDRCVEATTPAAQKGYTTEGVLKSMQLYYNYVGLNDTAVTTPPTRGLSQFLRDIDVHKDDFLVLKMDVEGLEYDLIERLMSDGSYRLIDEMFVEIHYNHSEMHPWQWSHFKQSRNDAQALFNKARDLGMYIHPWP